MLPMPPILANNSNDNAPKERGLMLKELSKASGLREDDLLRRLAMVLRERNEDLLNIIDVARGEK